MTLREDLEKAIRHADGVQTQDAYTLASDYAMDLLRDHGQALVEALVDAERYKHLRDQQSMEGFWIAHGKFGEGCSRWNGEAADKAIDAARGKGVSDVGG